jgi:hypothetical protein
MIGFAKSFASLMQASTRESLMPIDVPIDCGGVGKTSEASASCVV